MIQKNRYLQLVEEFPLRPLRSERELAKATAIAGRLAVSPRLSRDEQDYLDVLAGLIERYEDEHHQIEATSGAELLAFLLEENGLSQAQLARETGIAKSTLSAVLQGRRRLSLAHVTALGRRFKLEPSAFLAGAEQESQAYSCRKP
jgi:HTH-type transcriptional regulator/antitoxin HigA